MWFPEPIGLAAGTAREESGIVAATIVHFGQDTCFRLPVLRSGGYTVETCASLEQLAILASKAEVVTLEEEPGGPIREVLALTRARSQASVVLFRNDSEAAIPKDIDLVIPAFTAPEDWLKQIAGLLQQRHTGRGASPGASAFSAARRDHPLDARTLHQAHGALGRESGFGLKASHDFQCIRELGRGSIISSLGV